VFGGVFDHSSLGDMTWSPAACVNLGGMSVPSAQAGLDSVRGGAGAAPPPFPPLSCENAMPAASVAESTKSTVVIIIGSSSQHISRAGWGETREGVKWSAGEMRGGESGRL
jgi:hypothetical protein